MDLLVYGYEYVSDKSENEFDMLYDIAKTKDKEALQNYIESGFDLNIVNKTGMTVAFYCLNNYKYESGLFLINAGCDINIHDIYGDTLLTLCCYNRNFNVKNLSVIKALIDKGCDLDVQNKDGMTGLHNIAKCYCSHDHLTGQIGQILIEAGCRLDIKCNKGYIYKDLIRNVIVKGYVKKALKNRWLKSSLLLRCVEFIKKFGQNKFKIKSLNKDIRCYFIKKNY